MKSWAVLKVGIQAVQVARLKRKVYRQADAITRAERSRAGLKKENAELRAQLARALKR